jgi:hypothetical protein
MIFKIVESTFFVKMLKTSILANETASCSIFIIKYFFSHLNEKVGAWADLFFLRLFALGSLILGQRDTQHNDTKYTDIHHKKIKHNYIQHYTLSITKLIITGLFMTLRINNFQYNETQDK